MNRFQYFILALLLLTSGAASAFTPWKKDCYNEQLPVPYTYCVHTPTNIKPNGDVAYLLHGRGLNENTWNLEKYYTGMIQKYWESKNIAPPTVVSVSFGPIWLLAPRAESPKSGLAPTFAYGVIATVEDRIGEPKRRLLFGESMGGLNSLLLSLQFPDMFQKVASLCPVVYNASPYDPQSVIDDLIARTGADEDTLNGAITMAKQYFANDKEWQAASPLKVIEKLDVAVAPEYYVSCGIYDAFGNFEGSEIFAERAQARGIKVEWRPLFGNHCVTDPSSVADFLVR